MLQMPPLLILFSLRAIDYFAAASFSLLFSLPALLLLFFSLMLLMLHTLAAAAAIKAIAAVFRHAGLPLYAATLGYFAFIDAAMLLPLR